VEWHFGLIFLVNNCWRILLFQLALDRFSRSTMRTS
jgi:hypothetical protein